MLPISYLFEEPTEEQKTRRAKNDKEREEWQSGRGRGRSGRRAERAKQREINRKLGDEEGCP